MTLIKVQEMDLVQEMTKSLALVSCYAALGGMAFGIDNNYWSGMLGLAKFKEDFGIWDPHKMAWVLPSSWVSAGTGPPNAGLAFGCLASGFLGGRLGRVRIFQLSAVISLIGVLIQATAFTSYWQIMPLDELKRFFTPTAVGRIINSIALGIISNTVPAYQAECAPAKIRGTVCITLGNIWLAMTDGLQLVNVYQFSLLLGGLLVNIANWGMSTRHDQWGYRMVIILQFIVPLVLGGFSVVLPESPRWLIGKGRDAEAIRVLSFLRRGISQELVEEEVHLLSAAEEQNRRNFKTNSWKACFQGTNLRRTLIVTGVQCLQQAQGNAFISSYAVIFLQTIGIKDTYQNQILLVTTTTISSITVFYLADKLGRRWPMTFSAGFMAALMYIIAGITGSDLINDRNAMKAALGMLFIWKFFLATGWSSCVWIVTAEVPTLQLREKSIMTATFCGFCVSILVSFVNPFMQDEGYGNLRGRVGFVYGSFSVLAAVWTLFMLPETKGRSLEELDKLFEKKVSTWRFGTYKMTGFEATLGDNRKRSLEEEGSINTKGAEVVIGRELSAEAGANTSNKDRKWVKSSALAMGKAESEEVHCAKALNTA